MMSKMKQMGQKVVKAPYQPVSCAWPMKEGEGECYEDRIHEGNYCITICQHDETD